MKSSKALCMTSHAMEDIPVTEKSWTEENMKKKSLLWKEYKKENPFWFAPKSKKRFCNSIAVPERAKELMEELLNKKK